MKQVLTLLFSLSLLSSFSQIGTFKKVETNELKLRTMLNTDITKFLTTDANGKVVLATVSGGGASRFGIEDNTSDANRLIDFQQNSLTILNGTTTFSNNGNDITITNGSIDLVGSGGGHSSFSSLGGNAVIFQVRNFNDSYNSEIRTNNGLTTSRQLIVPDASGTIPVSVNGVFADATGNIDLGGGASLKKELGTFASYNATPQRNYLPKFTPKNSKDKRGEVGRVTFDETYEYIKTAKGWKRLPLSNF